MRLSFGLLGCIGLLGLTGCQSEELFIRTAASGQVELDGQPLSQGRILFIPAGDTEGPAASGTIQNGQFVLDRDSGPVVGDNRVCIFSQPQTGFDLDDETSYARAVQRNRNQPVLGKQPIPAQYNQNSKLLITVTEQPEEMHFALSTRPGAP